jgi:hypothetical protein
MFGVAQGVLTWVAFTFMGEGHGAVGLLLWVFVGVLLVAPAFFYLDRRLRAWVNQPHRDG